MKDTDLRGQILEVFYELRHSEDIVLLRQVQDRISEPRNVIANICDQLAEHGLIKWHPLKSLIGTFDGTGKISAFGVDVIEGTKQSPISINVLHDASVKIHNSSNVQIGDGNTLSASFNVSRIQEAIDASNASPAQKGEAKSLLERITSNPAMVAILSAFLSAGGGGSAS